MNKKFSILLIDDDFVFFQLLKKDFFDFCTLEHTINIDTLDLVYLKTFDAILIDLNIDRSLSGEMVFNKLQELNLKSSLLVLSADESIPTKLRLLQIGIDDYLWKSMHRLELQYRIGNAIKRRSELTNNTLGGLSLNQNFDATIYSKNLDLSKIEFKFLYVLLSQHPTPTKPEFIVEKVWKMTFVNLGTLNTLVWQLNKKLSDWEYKISFSKDPGIKIVLKTNSEILES